MNKADKYSFRWGLYLPIHLTFVCSFIILSEVAKIWTKGTETLEWIISTIVIEITNSECYDHCDFEFSLSVDHRASQIRGCALREVYWKQFYKIAVLGRSCADPFWGQREGRGSFTPQFLRIVAAFGELVELHPHPYSHCVLLLWNRWFPTFLIKFQLLLLLAAWGK